MNSLLDWPVDSRYATSIAVAQRQNMSQPTSALDVNMETQATSSNAGASHHHQSLSDLQQQLQHHYYHLPPTAVPAATTVSTN